MAKAWNAYRDTLIVVLLKITVLLGVGNHLYDPVRQQLIYSPRALIYRVTLHTTSLVVIFSTYDELFVFVRDIVGEKRFLLQLIGLCVWVNLIVVVLNMVSEWRNRGRGTRHFNELLSVRIDTSVRPEDLTRIRRQAWRLFFLKSVVAVLTASTSILIISLQCDLTIASIALCVGLNVVEVALLAFYYQFSVAMIYGGYLFKILNLRLSYTVRELNSSLSLSPRNARRLEEELTKLGLLHTSLLNLMTTIKEIYEVDMLVLLTSAFFFQACAWFYLLLALRGVFGEVSIAPLLYSTGNTLLNGFDLLVGLHICGQCVEACDAAAGILKGVSSFLVFDRFLERNIDMLCCQFAREKMHLTVCGMLELNARTGPGIFKGIMSNLILLTQISYDELH